MVALALPLLVAAVAVPGLLELRRPQTMVALVVLALLIRYRVRL